MQFLTLQEAVQVLPPPGSPAGFPPPSVLSLLNSFSLFCLSCSWSSSPMLPHSAESQPYASCILCMPGVPQEAARASRSCESWGLSKQVTFLPEPLLSSAVVNSLRTDSRILLHLGFLPHTRKVKKFLTAGKFHEVGALPLGVKENTTRASPSLRLCCRVDLEVSFLLLRS